MCSSHDSLAETHNHRIVFDTEKKAERDAYKSNSEALMSTFLMISREICGCFSSMDTGIVLI